MRGFVALAAAAEGVLVVAGHWSDRVLMLSGVLGTVIPFVLALRYGMTAEASLPEAAVGGVVIGVVSAALGAALALLLGDQTWMVLTYGPPAAGVTGLLGATAGTGLAGRGRGPTEMDEEVSLDSGGNGEG